MAKEFIFLPEKLRNVLVIDIETVAQTATYDELSDTFKKLWDHKHQYATSELNSSEYYLQKAGIFSEFGKVIVLGVGFFYMTEDKQIAFRTKALIGDEAQILTEFKTLIETRFPYQQVTLCAHNGKEFDFPFLGRRYLVNGIPLPSCLDLSGKKPWEVTHIDTLELWKFGDRKNFTSLALLAAVFNLPTSKDDIDGSDVHRVYYQEDGLKRIAQYCVKDVVLTARLFLRMNLLGELKEELVQIID